jgi:hypothetical protein
MFGLLRLSDILALVGVWFIYFSFRLASQLAAAPTDIHDALRHWLRECHLLYDALRRRLGMPCAASHSHAIAAAGNT